VSGNGDLPPVVQPDLVRDGRLVEVMPNWRFRTLDLSLVHLGNRHMPKALRVQGVRSANGSDTVSESSNLMMNPRSCRRLRRCQISPTND
jgi:hypothetical protein